METGEKKIKQSILSIAIILLLCGYFSAQPSTDSKQLEKTDREIEIFYPDIDNKLHQGETLHDGIEFKETKTEMAWISTSNLFDNSNFICNFPDR